MTGARASEGEIVELDLPEDGRDLTRLIETLIAAAPDGSARNPTVIAFRPGARYRVEGTIDVVDRHHLWLTGEGTTFYATAAPDGNVRIWNVLGGSDIVLQDLAVEGPNRDAGPDSVFEPDRANSSGVVIAGTQRATLRNVAVRNTYGDCVMIRHDGRTSTPARDVVVDGRTRLESCGRQGIAITFAERVTIRGIYVGNSRLKNLDVEPEEGWAVSDVTFSDNVVGPAGSYAWGANGRKGTVISGFRGVRNHFLEDMRWGYSNGQGKTLENYVIQGNWADRPARECIRVPDGTSNCSPNIMILRHVDGLTIRNNRQPILGDQRFPGDLTGSTGVRTS